MVNRQKNILIPFLLILTDIIACSAALFGIYSIRFHFQFIPIRGGYEPADYLRIFPIAVIIWIISFGFVHLYRSKQRAFSFEIFHRICKGSLLAIIILIAFNFFVREAEYARILFPMALISTIIISTLGRFVLSRILINLSVKNGFGTARVLIVGTGTIAKMISDKIIKNPHYGYQVLGFISYNKSNQNNENNDHEEPKPILGSIDEFREILKKHSPNQVFFTQSNFPTCRLIDFMMDAEKEMVEMKIVPNIFEMLISEIDIEDIEGIPLFGLKETPLQGMNVFIKRVFDFIFSLTALILLSPLFILTAILIKIDSKGPVFYRQKRVSTDGSSFNIYKFRSMEKDAESKTGPVWAKDNDSRVTKIGSFLRKYDIDELPQLFNVLRGDMSVVGPRPERPFFVEKFKEEIPRYMSRHKVKTGMTGWAQANGLRGNTSLIQRIKYDLFYIENWSLWFDIKIILMTIFRHFLKLKSKLK